VEAASVTLRDRRYGLRMLLWDVSGLGRLRSCGRGRRGEYVGVRGVQGGAVGFSGLMSCGSVWACPVCSARILAQRSLELGCGLLSWEGQGGRVAMGTLTMRHDRGHSLVEEWEALSRAWDSILRSRVWAKWRERLGSPGLVRVVEVTYGPNGWHVHLHFALLLAGTVSTPDLDELAHWLTAKWDRALRRAGMPGALAVGQDLHLVDGDQAAVELGGYLAKSTAYGAAESLGRELMGTWSKTARFEHSTDPAWHLAERFRETGELDLLDLWHQYEKGSKGRRQATWTNGLRKLLDLGVEETDEEIAAHTLDSADRVLITAAGWHTAWRSPKPTSRILAALHGGGTPALCAYLDAQGIEYLGGHE
jgi:hypothetical protein